MSSCNKVDDCKSCHIGKDHALPHKSSTSVYTYSLELIYDDIWGFFPTISIDGYKYFINFVDAFFLKQLQLGIFLNQQVTSL